MLHKGPCRYLINYTHCRIYKNKHLVNKQSLSSYIRNQHVGKKKTFSYKKDCYSCVWDWYACTINSYEPKDRTETNTEEK